MAHLDDSGNVIKCKVCENHASSFVCGVFPLCESHAEEWLDYWNNYPNRKAIVEQGNSNTVFYKWMKEKLNNAQ